MKRLLSFSPSLSLGFAFLIALSSCASDPVDSAAWLSPSASATLSGQVVLIAEPLLEPAPPNAVFYVGENEIAKSDLENGDYRVVWNLTDVEPGLHVLSVKPYGQSSVELPVRVSTSPERPDYSETPESPPGEAEGVGSDEDPFALQQWFTFFSQVEAVTGSVPPLPMFDEVYSTQGVVLRTLQSEVTPLPRGLYAYDDETKDWLYTPDASNLLTLTFDYTDEVGVLHVVEATAEWLATQEVTQGMTRFELPSLADIMIVDRSPETEEVLGEFSWEAAYWQPQGCPVSAEPEFLSLKGSWFAFAPPLPIPALASSLLFSGAFTAQ